LLWKFQGEILCGAAHGVIGIEYLLIRAIAIVGSKHYKEIIHQIIKNTADLICNF